MTRQRVTAVLPRGLLKTQQRWLALPRKQQDELYAAEFAPAFAPLFAELPLHGAPAGFERPRALVSVLGFSWQPVALMAAWARPERMLVIGTKESLALKVAGKGVLTLVSRLSGVERDRIRSIAAGDPRETDIYRAVRDFLLSAGIAPRQIFIDPTGGKKSMSSSAALAGFLAGAPLVYVDYGEYHGPNRIPVAGTEYPRLLANPLDVLGDLELRDIFAVFNRSDCVEARHLAAEKPSLALLLTYAAVERYVDLCLWVDFGLDDEAPDYRRIDDVLDRKSYEQAGRRMFGKSYRARELDGPLMFSNGAQLLAALSPDRLDPADLGVLAGLSSARNKCEYEHGFLPKTPSLDEVCRYLEKARKLVARIFDGAHELDDWITACRFPMLTVDSCRRGGHGKRASGRTRIVA